MGEIETKSSCSSDGISRRAVELSSWEKEDGRERPTRIVNRSYQRFCGCRFIRERGRGQFSETREAETLQERLGCREAETGVCTSKFLHKLEIPKFHNEPALVGVEKSIDFRLADWLPKGDAGEHFKARRCHLKISARATLFAHIGGQRLVFDPGSQDGHIQPKTSVKETST